MPKHQANLDFRIDATSVSSQYDLDGQLAMRITIQRPGWTGIPVRMGAANFCQFRGMLFKSSIYFQGEIGLSVMRKGTAQLLIGDSPRTAPLKDLGISPQPLMTAFFPSSSGTLDDHYEGWFLAFDEPPATDSGPRTCQLRSFQLRSLRAYICELNLRVLTVSKASSASGCHRRGCRRRRATDA